MKKYINKIQALTLIELLAVISIMGIMASITAGFIKFYQPTIQLIGASRTLKSNLETVRAKTVAEQQTYSIKFNTSENSYELKLLSSIISTIEFPDPVSFVSVGPFTNDTISFNKAGAASESGSIILTNTNGDQRIITISPSGYVQSN